MWNETQGRIPVKNIFEYPGTFVIYKISEYTGNRIHTIITVSLDIGMKTKINK